MAGLVVATSLPTIFWREVLARPSPSWITVLGAGAAVLLLLATLVVNELRSLRLFGAVLLAQALGFAVIDLVGSSAAYRAWALAQPAALSFAAANSAKLVPVTLAAVVLAASGSTREQLFMRLGDMRALAELPLPITRRKTTWPRLALHVRAVADGSLKDGLATPSLVVAKLQSLQRQNPIQQTLQELGRIDKTNHMLSYVDDETKRRRALVVLNW